MNNNIPQLIFEAVYDGAISSAKALLKYNIIPFWKRKVEELKQQRSEGN